jgi:copper chaperone NosL
MRGAFGRTVVNARFSAIQRLLDRPVSFRARLLLLAAIAVLLAGAVLPLWRISLVAPQYAEGLTLDMYAWQIVAGNGGQDLAEINTLNHYIGMKPIAQADFLEMKVLPFAIGAFSLLTLRALVIGRVMSLVDLAVLFFYFGAFSLGSFIYRLYSYGHHLDPHAPMKIKPFMPVVIGSQPIANFEQTSLPLAGTACMTAFLVLLLSALWLSIREARREAA